MFRFGEVEAALQAMQMLAPGKEKAFRSRLRNFRRAGLAIGVGAGRGPKPSLTVIDAVKLAVAIELGKHGNTPERCVEMITKNEGPLRAATDLCLRSPGPIVISYYPDAWSDLSNREFDHDQFACFSLGKLADQGLNNLLGTADHGVALINFKAVLEVLMENLEQFAPRAELREQLRTWTGAPEDD